MPCARCGSDSYAVKDCPWPLALLAPGLYLLAPAIRLALVWWTLSLRAGAMLP